MSVFWETAEGYHPNTPMHVLEGMAGKWEPWFAWYPVVLSTKPLAPGRRVWLKRIERRWFYPALWFVPPAPMRWREFRLPPSSGGEK